MPPKNKGGKDSKAREKAVEDKTFGLKNKKGAKGQKIVAQVKQSMDATANRGSRGPSKKEMKEMQKAQEAEMLALFNAVPKKKDDTDQKQEDLDPEAGPTFTDITQEIEYQRANVVAKTKITEEVFQAWRKKKMALRLAAAEAEKKERHRKGLLTGREIFMEAKVVLTDDDTAADDADMLREVDEELEIAKMNAIADAERRRACAEVGMDDGNPEEASTSSAAQKIITGVELSAEDAALLADDADDVDLDALEASLAANKL